MKNLYLGLLSVLFGTMFWLGVVNGDIIDSDWISQENSDDYILRESDEREFYVAGRKEGEVKELIPNSVWKIIVSTYEILFIVSVGISVLFFVFSLFLWNLLENLAVKPWKSLIPSFYWIKKRMFVAFLLIIIWFIWYMMMYIINCPYHACYYNNDGPIYYPNDEVWIFDLVWNILLGLGLFLFYFIMLIAYYRLFRKFWWNKIFSILWALFFPVWICVLCFWNFNYQRENLEKKEGDD